MYSKSRFALHYASLMQTGFTLEIVFWLQDSLGGFLLLGLAHFVPEGSSVEGGCGYVFG